MTHLQCNHCNEVLHWLQPNLVKDAALNKEIHQQQYNNGTHDIPRASQTLFQKVKEQTLQLTHKDKNYNDSHL